VGWLLVEGALLGAIGGIAGLRVGCALAQATVPGVKRAEFLRDQQILLDPARPRIVLLARTT